MESVSPPLIEAPPSQPGSVPLRNRRHEQYCRLRVLGISPIAAVRDSGFTAGLASPTAETDKNAGLRGVISKLERNKAIRARIQYLAGNTDDVLREKRRKIEECLWNILDAPIKRVMTAQPAITDDDGNTVRAATVELDVEKVAALDADEQTSLYGTIKTVTFLSGGSVKLEPYPVTEAASQLRALNGLDAPKRMELTGADGGPMQIARVERVIVDPADSNRSGVPAIIGIGAV